MRCSSRKQDGSRCKAPALRGGKFCNFHSMPGRAAQVGREGGLRRRVYNPDKLRVFPAPKSPAALLDLLAETIIDVRAARIDPRTGNSIGVLAGACHQLIRSVSLEERVAALERRNKGSN
jgi:hypothetical protein